MNLGFWPVFISVPAGLILAPGQPLPLDPQPPVQPPVEVQLVPFFSASLLTHLPQWCLRKTPWLKVCRQRPPFSKPPVREARPPLYSAQRTCVFFDVVFPHPDCPGDPNDDVHNTACCLQHHTRGTSVVLARKEVFLSAWGPYPCHHH